MLHVACLALALFSTADATPANPPEPLTFGPKELAVLARKGHPEDANELRQDRDNLLKRYHGRQVRVTGTVRLPTGGIELELPFRNPSMIQFILRIETDVQTVRQVRKIIEQNQAARRGNTVLTFVAEADFRRSYEGLAPDYVIPPDLLPRQRVRILTGQQVWEEAMRAAGEGLDPRIMEDARKKGKLVTIEHYSLYGLKGAQIEGPKKVVPIPVDPEKTAAAKLALAQQLLSEARTRAGGIARLREIVRDYPNTKAAGEAKELLKKY